MDFDTDGEREVIIVVSSLPPQTVAMVFHKHDAVWWQIGYFSYWWHWEANRAEHLIELREITGYERKEIIVRERLGGTGVATTDLTIYRLHRTDVMLPS